MKNRKSRRGPVWICSNHGAVLDLSAVIYGPLAVTHALARFVGESTDGKYVVTHIPTGYAIEARKAISFKEARAVCGALLDSGIPWAKVRPESAKRYGKKVKAVLKAVGIDLVA